MKLLTAAALAVTITGQSAQARPIVYVASPTITTFSDAEARNYTNLYLRIESDTKEVIYSHLESFTCCTRFDDNVRNQFSVRDVMDSYDQESLIYDTDQFRVEFIFGTEFLLLDRKKPYREQAINVPYEFQVIDKLNNFRSDWKTGELSGLASASAPPMIGLLALGLLRLKRRKRS